MQVVIKGKVCVAEKKKNNTVSCNKFSIIVLLIHLSKKKQAGGK